MNILKYKNYRALVELSAEDQSLIGRVEDIDGLIMFSAESVSDLVKEFHAAIEIYLEDCARHGIEPERPYKGSFNVRVGSDCHRHASRVARHWNVTLNEFTRLALLQAIDRHRPPLATIKTLDEGNVISSRAYGYLDDTETRTSSPYSLQ